MRIEFGDLKIPEETKEEIRDSLNTNWVSQGPKVERFERAFGELFGYPYNIAVSNGTCADIAACMALYDDPNVQRGDEIIAPALAFAAVGNSILTAGFKPVFVDIERETLNINPGLIREKITPKTRAIMAVHTMGKPCNMREICKLAKEFNLRIIEDCCEAHGAIYNEKLIGTFGDMAAFSFYIAHLICCGEGGMVSTSSKELADRITSIRSHGRKPGSLYFDHLRLGLNLRTTDLHACIGLAELAVFPKTFVKRRENLFYLLGKTSDLKDYAYFNLEEPHEKVAPHAFSVVLTQKAVDEGFTGESLDKFLQENSIKSKRTFGSMPTQHNAFAFLGHKLGDFPESEFVGTNGIHFGIHQYLTKDDLDYVSDVLHRYFGKKKNGA